MTRTAPRRALVVLACALMLLALLAAGRAAGAAQERPATTTTVLEKGDRATNYEGFTFIALGLVAWAVVFGVVLYRSPRRASMLRRRS